jgi:peptidoglycan-associated lipoprotein
LTATFALSGCSGKKWYWPFGAKKTDGSATSAVAPADSPANYTGPVQESSPEVPPVASGPSTSGPSSLPLPEGGVVAPDASGSLPAAQEIRKSGILAAELKMIHFDYDRSELTADSKRALDTNAEWLLQHPGIQVQIEGHCDERGTVEYNLSLGQRRADSVREYLVTKGIDANTLHTISYGKERPLSFGPSDADHAMNRRAQFLIFSD